MPDESKVFNNDLYMACLRQINAAIQQKTFHNQGKVVRDALQKFELEFLLHPKYSLAHPSPRNTIWFDCWQAKLETIHLTLQMAFKI